MKRSPGGTHARVVAALSAAWLCGCAGNAAAPTCSEDGGQPGSFVHSLALGSLTETSAKLRHHEDGSSCKPDHYYRFHVADTSVALSNDLAVTLAYDTKPPLLPDGGAETTTEFCAYVACSDGSTNVTSCTAGSQALTTVNSDDGFRGCCRSTEGPLAIGYLCNNGASGLSSDDSADVFVHVCLSGEAAVSYSISAHF